ncbi:MAG: hypothetical protein IPN95_03915 [Bacteroidetes bacterium]|nr:hypothetical protein [Bacteroidota bacterium]
MMTTSKTELSAIGTVGWQPTKQEIGAKALHLHLASSWGFNVPKGFVIPAVRWDGAPSIPSELAASLLPAAEKLGPGPYAVRSSATLEDGSQTSFAGQFVSILNVPKDGLSEAVLSCLQSLDAAQVKAYHASGGGAMAVLIQQMVPADVAGVAFSANPVSGNRHEVVIEAVTGLGEKLVSGEVSPEEIVWNASEIQRKGAAVKELTEPMIAKIAEVAKVLESKFGCPQDIEWAFSNGEFFLLQSRPITALPIAPIPIAIEIPKGSWKRDDHHTIPTPFTWDLFFDPYGKAFTEVLKTYGLPVKGMDFKLIGGHLYARMEMAGGGGSKNPPDWVMWLVARLIPAMRKMNKHAGPFFDGKSYRKPVVEWEASDAQWFKDQIASFNLKTLGDLSTSALIQQMDQLKTIAIKGAQVHAGLGMASFTCIGVFAIFCKSHLGWDYKKTLAVLSGNSGATTQHLVELETICLQNLSHAQIQEMPLERKTIAQVLEEYPKLNQEFSAWMERHTMRMSDYDVNNPTWGENLHYLHQTLASQLQQLKAGNTLTNRLQKEDGVEIDAARTQLADSGLRSEFEELLEWARKGYFIRDANGIECISKVWGMLRLHLLEAGRRISDLPNGPEDMVMLTQAEVVQALQGKFQNLKATILHRLGERQWAKFNRGPAAYGPAEAPLPNLAPFPSGLKKLFGLFEFMTSIEPDAASNLQKSDSSNLVNGLGVFAGKYTGIARIVEGPHQFSRVQQGEILVCRITSGEWSVLFNRLGALVTEEGGYLSHPAIIAREFALPAVVACENVTKKIVDGQVITVDGTTGTVFWE